MLRRERDLASRRTILTVNYRVLDLACENFLDGFSRSRCSSVLVDDSPAFLAVHCPIIDDEELLAELQSLDPDHDDSDTWQETALIISTERQVSKGPNQGFNYTEECSSPDWGKSYYLNTHKDKNDHPYVWSANYHDPIEVNYTVSGNSVDWEINANDLHPEGSLQSRILNKILEKLFTIIDCNTSCKVEMTFSLHIAHLVSSSKEHHFQMHRDRLRSRGSVTYGCFSSALGKKPLDSLALNTLIQRIDNNSLAAGLRYSYYPKRLNIWSRRNPQTVRRKRQTVEKAYSQRYSLLFTNDDSLHQGAAGGKSTKLLANDDSLHQGAAGGKSSKLLVNDDSLHQGLVDGNSTKAGKCRCWWW